MAAVFAASVLALTAADLTRSNSAPEKILLLGNLGRLVQVPTNELPQSLQPSAGIGLRHQLPNPVEGVKVPAEVLQRMQESREGGEKVRFFPAVQPRLMPYLAGLDEHGNTAIRPGALVPFVPLEPVVQQGKYWLSEQGLRYSLEQTFTYVSLGDVMKGDSTLGFYTFDLKTKWAVFDAPAAGTAGWISAQIEAKNGLGSAGDDQSAKSNLGTTTDPTGIWSSHNGWRIPELAWQESLRNGELVVVAGIVSQRNYLDGNAAAHTGRGEFMNSALIHSQVLPLTQYNFGLNLQWQPMEEWYVMLGGSAGDAPAGSVPWTDFNWEDWSVVGEFGYAPEDFLGLGSGVYRVQRFVAANDGRTQDGMGLNIQQRLGLNSPFSWFGRFGYGGSKVTPDAAAEVGTGFVMEALLKYAGLAPRLSNDLLGVGFVWSQPPATTKTVYHENEYVLETFYALQITPTMKLQPDFQVVWDPAFSPSAGPATVFQLQLNIAW